MSFSLNSGVITQSGTDTNLGGLSALGITTSTYNELTVYDMSNYKLVVTGTLTHDPDTEVLAWSAVNKWTPAELPTHLWFDGADDSTITHSSNAVSQWRDKSGNNRHANASGTNSPQFVSNALNGNSLLRFDGTDDRLEFTGGFVPGDFVVIFKRTSNAQTVVETTTGTHRGWVGSYGADWATHDKYSTNGYPLSTTQPDNAYGSDYFMVYGSDTSWTLGLPSDGGQNFIGRGSPGYQNLNGDVAEFIVFTSTLSDTDRDRVHGYLAHKWGQTASLPVGNPYKTTPPFTGSLASTGVGPMMRVTGTYNYGKERTANGNTIYSNNTGIICVNADTGAGELEWDVTKHGLIQNDGGTINMYGGAIASGKPFGLAGATVTPSSASSITIKNTKIYRPSGLASSERREIRFDDVANSISGSVENLIVDGFLVTHRNLPSNFSVTLLNGAIGQLASGPASSTLRDLNTSDNIRTDYDLGTDDDATGAKFYTVINASEGSNTRCMPKEGIGDNRQLGGAIIQKEVSFKIKDSSGSALSGVKVYTKDTNNSYRKNANGQDHTADKTYSATTDANGDTGTLTVTTAITNIDSKGNSSSTPANYALWDTTADTNRYKVDRRGLDDSGSDIFSFGIIEYGKIISTTNQALKGVGELAVDWVLFDDALITDSKENTDALTEIDTPQKFYNRAKAYLVDNYAGEASTIVSRQGNSIDAGSYNVVVNGDVTDAASAFAISGNTLTIKASTFTGNISTSGTTTLNNGAEVIGTFGSTTVLPWTVKNVEGTSRIQLVNVTDNAEIVNTKYSSSDPFIDVTGTYTSSQIAVGDTVRLRVTCVVGATALLPVVQTGVATESGIVFQVDQEADAIYNANGIDASQITTFTADYTNSPMGIDLTETDGLATVQELYAFLAYSQTTADGVDKWFNAVRAIDGSNYQIDQTIADIKFQNVGTKAVNITGGRIFRKDGTSVLHAENGDYPITLDTGSLVTNIQPQIEAGLNANAKISSTNNNSKLIPSLL